MLEIKYGFILALFAAKKNQEFAFSIAIKWW